MKKVILALLSALALSMPLTAGAADFIRLDGASYDTMWQKGKPSRNTAPWKIPCTTA